PPPARRPGETGAPGPFLRADGCFNPPPARRPGETRPKVARRCSWVFQSAPGPEAGGNSPATSGPAPTAWCFNPPPALRPGETRWPRPGSPRPRSFNPPPALRPGETHLPCVYFLLYFVSIRPRPGGRGNWRTAGATTRPTL